MTLSVLTFIHTVSEANNHRHWRERQQRAKKQRHDAFMFLRVAWRIRPPLPATVTLTRLSPRTLDSDNLQSALKHVRDGVADYFGVDDGDDRYTWQYRQRKAKEAGVLIEIEQTEVAAA